MQEETRLIQRIGANNEEIARLKGEEKSESKKIITISKKIEDLRKKCVIQERLLTEIKTMNMKNNLDSPTKGKDN